MAHVLKMFQLAQHHGVAQMNIGRGGVHAELHAQGLAGLRRFFELRFQLVFANDFRGALSQIGELFLDRFESSRKTSSFSPSGRSINTRRPSMR